jgi:hypothetical protein
VSCEGLAVVVAHGDPLIERAAGGVAVEAIVFRAGGIPFFGSRFLFGYGGLPC